MSDTKKRNIKRSPYIVKAGKAASRIRKNKNISQERVALDVGLSFSTLSRIENGTTDPLLSTYEKLSKSLGISPSELFAEAEYVHLEYPLVLQKLDDLLRYEPNYILDAVYSQVKTLLEAINHKK